MSFIRNYLEARRLRTNPNFARMQTQMALADQQRQYMLQDRAQNQGMVSQMIGQRGTPGQAAVTDSITGMDAGLFDDDAPGATAPYTPGQGMPATEAMAPDNVPEISLMSPDLPSVGEITAQGSTSLPQMDITTQEAVAAAPGTGLYASDMADRQAAIARMWGSPLKDVRQSAAGITDKWVNPATTSQYSNVTRDKAGNAWGIVDGRQVMIPSQGGYVATDPNAEPVNTALEGFDEEAKLREKFRAESKPFIQQNDAYARIQASAKDPSGAGDLALIFNYMKLLDPGSTVREGEFAQVGKSGGLPANIQVLFEQAISGRRLNDTIRNDVLTVSKRLYKEAAKNYQKRAEQFGQLADSYNLDRTRVIPDSQLYDIGDIEDSGGSGGEWTQEDQRRLEELRAKHADKRRGQEQVSRFGKI